MLDQVLMYARTLEGAQISVAATRDSIKAPVQHLASAKIVSRIGYKKAKDRTTQTAKRPQDRRVRKLTCIICGSKDHYVATCPLKQFKDSLQCQSCRKYAHIANECLKKRHCTK